MKRQNVCFEDLDTEGYTLLEVMVALIIIGISITAVTGALSTAKGLSSRSDHAIESVRILNNILNNPELMKMVVENKNFEKTLEDEDGWVCRAETTPLVVNSADLVWDIDSQYSDSGNTGKKGSKNSNKNGAPRSKKTVTGEEIEVPGMVSITLCVSQTNQLINKEYCVSRWKRQQDSTDIQIVTTPVKAKEKTK
ncbi:MAG: type II secretion system protein [Desulfamplus sp.]|nr:type II secretion system protein [Desulfamplus sp.]